MATNKTIPIKNAKPKNQYDCLKCPGYCCSYPLIEVTKRDMERVAKHFEVSLTVAKKKFFRYDRSEKSWCLRRKNDEHFKKICRFFDTEERRCTIYTARPGVCREYPGEPHCGYYDFLKFEREHQQDKDFIATTS
jgi:Fe-S-cluster containining protein